MPWKAKLENGRKIYIIAILTLSSMPLCGLISCIDVDNNSVSESLHLYMVPQDYPTVQEGIDAATDNSVVLIASGVYRENIVIEGKSLTLTSLCYNEHEYIGETVIDGGGETVITVGNDCEDTVISGLTIQNGADGITVYSNISIHNNRIVNNSDGIDYEGAGGICRDNEISNNRDDAIDLDGPSEVNIIGNNLLNNGDDGIEIRLHPYSGPELNINIENNIIYGNLEDGIQLVDYGDISDRRINIIHNVIHNNTMAGLGCMSSGNTREDFSGAPIPEPITAVNNTFIGNAYGITGGANMVVINNIISQAEQTAVKNVAGDSIVAYNLFWDNGNDYESSNLDPGDSNYFNEDPLLNQNYSLDISSLAIDAGVAFFIWQGDVVLDLRPSSYSGSAPDIGFYEKQLSQ